MPALTRRRFTLAAALTLAPLPRLAHSQDTAFWDLLREGGCVLLMRHAQTEAGNGDPPGFMLGDCSTQRLLSDAGRAQARRMAAAFQRERVQVQQVRSSAWCRCVETAQLAYGKNTVWPVLNAAFDAEERKDQTLDVADDLTTSWDARRNQALVTHHFNVEALTGVTPAMGEILLTRPDPATGSATPLRVLARQTF